MSIDDASPEDWDRAHKRQVGGNHYSRYNVQPIDFIIDNNLDWCEANVVKYITRWRDKNGIEDLRKAMHYIQLLIEREQTM
jgi:hypothetical protein